MYYKKLINNSKIDIFVSGIVRRRYYRKIETNSEVIALAQREPIYAKTIFKGRSK